MNSVPGIRRQNSISICQCGVCAALPPVRPMSQVGLEDLELASRVWRIMDDFGRGEAEFVPYWSNAEYVRADSAGIHVSLYRHPAKGVLAVVSNLGRQRTAFALILSWESLGLDPAAISIVDGLQRSPARLDGDLDPFGWRLLWIRPNGS